MFKRLLVLLYGVACYVLFLATFLYAVGFVGNIAVPRSIDSPREGDVVAALLIDTALLLLFAVQHSGMARDGFKRQLTRLIPPAAERSTYVLASSLALIVLFAFWRPLGGSVWQVQGPAALVLNALCALGWTLVFVSTLVINHFDLFGLRQAWLNFRGVPYHHVGFRQPGPYRYVRHPLYVGFLFAFWATPSMTLAHLLFAVATTGYILVAIQLEERDLVRHLGDAYRNYRQRVPMLIPWKGANRDEQAPTAAVVHPR